MRTTAPPLRLFPSPAWRLPLALVLFLSGCAAVGPDYIRPDTVRCLLPGTRPYRASPLPRGRPENLSAWWTTLNDPLLSSLIDRAVAGNLDLKKARARVREARARRGNRPGRFLPHRSTPRAPPPGADSAPTRGSGETSDLYTAGFDAGWELDIFGGVRRSVEAAEADLQATGEGPAQRPRLPAGRSGAELHRCAYRPGPDCRGRSEPGGPKRDLPVDPMAATRRG